MASIRVERISREATKPFLLGIHYAGRMCSISQAFGLFRDGGLEGVVTYGTPPSSTLRRGIAGDDYIKNVVELNRLCLKSNIKGDASFLVSHSLRMLQGDLIVVSFADTSMGHTGIVYQASNFSYHGLSAKRTDWAVRGKEHLHGQTIADEFRGCEGKRSDIMRQKYGDDFYLKPRPRKHRYVRVIGSRKFVKNANKAIKYIRCPYPKKEQQQ